ncbi:MAG: hypothetical protein JNL04_04545 [Rhodospirillaceae bacterium]|nr:hypothetical protein [Rhodospirillaceae bacterium]
MPNVNYALDRETGRYIRDDIVEPKVGGDVVLAPGQLAEIADGGRLQGVLTRARFLAAKTIDPTAEADLIRALWSLHEEGDVLLARWRSLEGFKRFANAIESAWNAVGHSAFIHFLSTDPEPICWSEGVDASDEKYRRLQHP